MAKKPLMTAKQRQNLQEFWNGLPQLQDDDPIFQVARYWQSLDLRLCPDDGQIDTGTQIISLKGYYAMLLYAPHGEITDIVHFPIEYATDPENTRLHYTPTGYPRGVANFLLEDKSPIVFCRSIPEAFGILENAEFPVRPLVYFERTNLKYLAGQYKNEHTAILEHDNFKAWLGKIEYDKGKITHIPITIDPANVVGFIDSGYERVFKPLNDWLVHKKPLTPLNAKESTPACKVNLTDGFGRWTLHGMVEHLYLIYGTDTVWDNLNKMRMRMSHLRHAVGNNDDFKVWQTHHGRKTVQDLVFEPSGQIPPNTINLFTGLPPQPEVPTDKCQKILAHIKRLCGGREDEYEWLINWMAYPLQHLGAKMDTAVIMYGNEGPGKSILWEKVMGKIYGNEYHRTIGQQQLESQFNGWLSKILFAQCEEVVSRAERNHHKGQLKHLVTGKKFLINEKMLPAHEETNHANFVFLSNSPIPLELDMGDRRYFVLRVDDVPTKEYFDELFSEINGEGVASFYWYLKSRDLKDFSPHTKPPLNNDKQKLIDASKPNPVLFYDEWIANDLSVPFGCCLKSELFKAYRNWCNERNEYPKRDRDFNAEIDRLLINARKDICFPSHNDKKSTQRVWITQVVQAMFVSQNPDAIPEVQRQAIAFHNALFPQFGDRQGI